MIINLKKKKKRNFQEIIRFIITGSKHVQLKKYNIDKLYLGTTPSEKADSPIKFFKGDIASVKIWDRDLTDTEVKNLHTTVPTEGMIYDLDVGDIDSYDSTDITIFS